MWVLGNELRFSGRALHVLNLQAFFPAPKYDFDIMFIDVFLIESVKLTLN